MTFEYYGRCECIHHEGSTYVPEDTLNHMMLFTGEEQVWCNTCVFTIYLDSVLDSKDNGQKRGKTKCLRSKTSP